MKKLIIVLLLLIASYAQAQYGNHYRRRYHYKPRYNSGYTTGFNYSHNYGHRYGNNICRNNRPFRTILVKKRIWTGQYEQYYSGYRWRTRPIYTWIWIEQEIIRWGLCVAKPKNQPCKAGFFISLWSMLYSENELLRFLCSSLWTILCLLCCLFLKHYFLCGKTLLGLVRMWHHFITTHCCFSLSHI